MLKTIAELRLQSSAADGDVIRCGNAWYKYSSTSDLVDNGNTVVRPRYKASGRWLKMGKNEHFVKVAKNETATLTAAEMLSSVITSTSAAATALTTPTAEAVMALIPGGAAGTSFDLMIDNSAGASTVTLTLGTGFTVSTPAITGGATLTVSTANAIALFRFIYTSATAAKVYRIF